MIDIPLHKSKAVRIKARAGEASVPQVFKFRNADGTPHPITIYDFKIPVYKRQNSTVKLFTLSIGDGLTVQGADDDELKIDVTKSRASQIADTNFFKLHSAYEDHTWLAGPWVFFQGEEDAVHDDKEITIASNGDEVIIEVIGPQTTVVSSAIVLNLRDDYDASGDVFPSAPTGSGASGAIRRFDTYPVSVGGVLDFGHGDEYVPAKSLLIAWADDPADGTEWRLL